jgi:hypothetical protein
VFDVAKWILEWENIMVVEHEISMKMYTWNLTTLPQGKKPMGFKWVFKVKYKGYGTLDKCKSFLVEKIFSHREGIDYEETIYLIENMIPI